MDLRDFCEPSLDRNAIRLADARRRAWFTRPSGSTGGDIRLANGRHLALFRSLPLMAPKDAVALLRDLCLGIARLERELSGVLGARSVDLRTPEDLSRYFRDEVLATAEVQYAAD